jgi:hypothetical protein
MTDISERWVRAMVQREGRLIFEGRDPCLGEPWSIHNDDPHYLAAFLNADLAEIDADPFFKFLHAGEA